jgi:Helix-turn-helix domain
VLDVTTEPQGIRPDPDRDLVLDSRSLRGIAHPLRVRLLGRLREAGPSTASRLAVEIGTSSAATSYHLRQLAMYGFIVEDDGHAGDGRQPRERFWRAAHRSTFFDSTSSRGTPEDVAATEVYLRSVAQAYARRTEASLDEFPVSPEWRDAGTLSDYALVLNPEGTRRLTRELEDVIARYPRFDATEPEGSEGSRPVTVQLQIFPRPGWTAKDAS